MPTYTFACHLCGAKRDLVMSISTYVRDRPQPQCCGELMQRHFTVVPGLALHNALASDRIYEGLRADDGTDISTRAKHRAYMRERGLTTMDDFKDTWAKDAREREARMAGRDAQRSQDIARAVEALGGENVAPRNGG